MNQQNILSFITQANMAGLNAINAGLNKQAREIAAIAASSSGAAGAVDRLTRSYRQAGAALRILAAAQAQYNANLRNRGAGGRFLPGQGVPASFYQQQLANASSFAKRMQLILSQAFRANAGAALAIVDAQVRAGLAGLQALVQRASAAIREALTFPNLARNLSAAFRGLGSGLGAAVVAGANAGGNAIRTLVVGALNAANAAARALNSTLRNIKGGIGNIGIVGSLALIGGVIASFKVDEALAKINTIARANKQVLDDVALGLERISATTGTTFSDLAEGYYDLLSAGLAVKDGNVQVALSLQLMKDATNLAVGGIGTVKDSLNFLTTALNAFRGPLTREFGDPLKASTVIADAFAKAVELGKVTVAELAPVFSTAAPLAAQLGISFREMAAVVASMTQQGFDAGEAFTALRSALVGTQRDSKRLQDALKDPIVSGELAQVHAKGWLDYLDAVGFQKFAEVLRSYSERSGVPLIKLLGRIEGVQAILGTTGAQAENYKFILDQITNSSGNAAEQAELFNDSLSAQLRLFKNALFAVGDALFRRRIIDPLKDFVRTLRQVTTAVLEFVVANKQLFDVIVPIFALFTSLAALTKGASAIENIFLRLPGPISGFAIGIGIIGRSLALVLGPLGLILVGISTLQRLVEFGILPLKTFGAVLADIAELGAQLANALKGAGGWIQGVYEAITSGGQFAGVQIDKLSDTFAKAIGTALDQATASLHLLIDDFTEAIVQLLADGLSQRAQGIARALLDAFKSAFEYLAPRLVDTFAQLFTFGAEVVTNLVDFGASVASAIGQSIIDALPKAAEFISGIPEAIGEAFSSGTAGSSIIGQLDEWARSFIGWWQENGPELARGILAVLRSAAAVVITAGRSLFARAGEIFGGIFDWLVDNRTEIINNVETFIGQVVDAIAKVASAIVPPLAEATGKLIDWVAAAIPGVFGAIARFIDEVVQTLVPLGNDGGPVNNAMATAGGQLVSWITDRIPGALNALADWALAVENWILTVFAPRVVAVFLGLGATLVGALLDGLVAAITHPRETAEAMAKGLAIVLGAAVILNAGAIAGAAVGVAFRTAMILASLLAQAFVGMATSLGTALLGMVAPATVAGTTTGTAFGAAMAGAVALAIPALIIGAGVAIAAAIDQLVPGLAKQIHDDFFAGLGALGRLIFGGDPMTEVVPIQVQPAVSFLDPSFIGPLTDSEIAARLAAGIQQPVKVAVKAQLDFTSDSFIGPLTDAQIAIKDSIKNGFDISSTVTDFERGLNGAADAWNAMPGKLKTAADLLREALKKPFDIKAQAKEFAADYSLIVSAMNSNNPLAIARANELKTAMITAANQTNAAFIAAGKAPPYLVDAITGQVTLAGTAATNLATGVTNPLATIPTAVTTAGNAFPKLPPAIDSASPAAGVAAGNFANAVVTPIKNGNGVIASSTSGTFHAFPGTINGAAPAAAGAANSFVSGVSKPFIPLPSHGKTWGKTTGSNFTAGLNAGKPALNTAVNGYTTKVDDINLSGKSYGWGYNTGDHYVDGLKNAFLDGYASFKDKFLDYKNLMSTNSPPGPKAALYGVDTWGFHTGMAWVDGMVAGLESGPAKVSAAIARTAAVLTREIAGPTLTLAYASGALPASSLARRQYDLIVSPSGGSSQTVTLQPGAVQVDARGATDPHAVGQAVADAMAQTLREQTARLGEVQHMTDYALGVITDLGYVNRYTGFDRPNGATLVRLLADGPQTTGLEILQQGSMPLQQAVIGGRTRTKSVIDQLKAYYDSREQVGWLDCDAEAILISSSSTATPAVITTATPHGLATEDMVFIEGHVGSAPDINGFHGAIIVLDATNFTIPAILTTGGGDGTVRLARPVRVFDLDTEHARFGDRNYNLTLIDSEP